jgi:hypothetical protein
MYVHPQEIDYNINTLFELIDASGLEFLGFSNPQVWQLERLVGKSPDLLERAEALSERQRYRLLEVLDPQSITHYEFFLGRPPLHRQDWANDAELLAAVPEPSPCLQGWQESAQFFNYDYQVVNLSEAEWSFLRASGQNPVAGLTVGQLLETVEASLANVRSLQRQQIILLGM